MGYGEEVLYVALRKLLVAQLSLLVLVVSLFLVIKGISYSLAAGYGGVIALINSIIMAWRVEKMSKKTRSENFSYQGSGSSFLSTLILMGVGMGLLKLDPLSLLFGFGITYLGYIYLGYQLNRHITK
ncbi:ATP synthase subunit I [Candidatus Nitrosacidococcus tergens]|uniref:ATP synthase I chain n=1 Tax=Candidatus Nitrosacidococcus tergens TaxID=553981 RepID=A0A7G1QCY6_9GAMM|nr:ATP synthase subunit I [Candidatus Nitrosacidococcus tergens]CAB1277635.1 conserved membrane protein of unknown function [Candidatus Nitrosacidococcus tergens]